MPPATFPLHQRIGMGRKVHPWGVPPWTVDFRPAPCALPDQVDFAIIGGGFTGLSTAAWLRRFAPGRSVLVLESASLGDGASGRTGGMALGGTPAAQRPALRAGQFLLATNAASLELSSLRAAAEPKLTFALATAPLSDAQLKAIGLSSRRPFYTLDFPYLWGRLLESNGVIFGAGLVPASNGTPFGAPLGAQSTKNGSHDLRRYDVRRGEAVDRLRWLEDRVRHLPPALASVRITHRWGGPILVTEKMRPIFRRHPRNKHVMVLAGYNGHGVALSVYLGKWAAQALLNRRPLPPWH